MAAREVSHHYNSNSGCDLGIKVLLWSLRRSLGPNKEGLYEQA
jgi:hypothetical protein